MKIENVMLRRENTDDYRATEELTREAFWNLNTAGCDEHYLLHIVRNAACFIPELDIVAEIDGKLIGNIVYTKAKLVLDGGKTLNTLSFGPVAVLPEYQKNGVGGMLIRHTLSMARELGYKSVFIYGDLEYYKRFSFVPAEQYKIGTAYDSYHDSLLATELQEQALLNISGRFFEDGIYDIDKTASTEFDKSFSYKELKYNLPSQQKFMQMVQRQKPRIV